MQGIHGQNIVNIVYPPFMAKSIMVGSDHDKKHNKK